MIPGIEIDFGSERLTVPPLTLGSLQLLQGKLEKFQADTSPESVATVIEAAFLALRRNYPDITRERVAEILDLGNMLDVLSAVMDVSGMKRKEIAAGKATPEASP